MATSVERAGSRPGEETIAEPTARDRKLAVADAKEALGHIHEARRLAERLGDNPAADAEGGLNDADGYLEYAARDVRILLGLLEH